MAVRGLARAGSHYQQSPAMLAVEVVAKGMDSCYLIVSSGYVLTHGKVGDVGTPLPVMKHLQILERMEGGNLPLGES